MSAQDDLKIFLNIMASSQSGLNDPDLIGKFARSKAQVNAFGTMAEIQAQQPIVPPTPPVTQNNVPTEPLGGGGMPSAPQGEIMA